MGQISSIPNTSFNSNSELLPAPNHQTSQWFWQSNSDPWMEKDPIKWIWTAFAYDIHCLIEKAFICNHSIADLGDCEIDLKKMLQVNKQDRNKVRRVRREAADQSHSRHLLELRPLTVGKDQKTINPAFGNVQHFLSYIMQRTIESYSLYQKLKDLTHSSKQEEYQGIVKEVISCVQKAAQARAKIIKLRVSSSSEFDFMLEADCIVDELSKNSGSLKDFLLAILRVYTMESFLCYWINELLRNENWEELNVLTPYLVCLAYTFKHEDYVMKYDPNQSFRALFGLINTNKLLLYRGAALTEEHLAYYDLLKIKYFSWNGVTSTSLLKEPAQGFIKLSLEIAKLQEEPKIGVLFTIESDFTSSSDCEGMIDVSSNSKVPEEKEVILAPGTVFELLSVQRGRGGIANIRLKVTKKFNEQNESLMLLGALQERVIFKNKAIFDDLTKGEMIKALQLLEGHQMITKLEIKNCLIDSHLMELITKMRLTTKIKLEDIEMKANKIKVDRLNQLWYYFSDENLDMICEHNSIFLTKDQIEKPEPKEANWNLQKLCLGERAMDKIYQVNQLKNLFHIFKAENKIVKIDLACCSYAYEKIILKDIMMLIAKLWSCLESLSLKFVVWESKGDDVLERLKYTMSRLACLNYLSLNFSDCSSISNKGLSSLGDTIRVLKSLQHLSLHFSDCSNISNEGLSILGEAIEVRKSLRYLSLHFSNCSSISNKGLSSLSDAIKLPTSLQYLSLNFYGCSSISNEGLNSLSDAIKVLTSLQQLSLDFSGCSSISNEGLSSLQDSIKLLKSLQHLSLHFSDCFNLSNEGLSSLQDAIKAFTLLQCLSLCFSRCSSISNDALSSLRDAIKTLTSLQQLSLDYNCSSISNQGLSSLRDAIKGLTSLQQLSLNFHGCSSISNEGLISLLDAITILTSLRRLSLDFSRCSSISKEGLIILSDAIKELLSLQSLSLNFLQCPSLSDEVLSSLRDDLKGYLIPEVFVFSGDKMNSTNIQ